MCLSSRTAITTRSPSPAMVSATVRTRCSSAGERKNGRRKGQWTRSPKVNFAWRMRRNKSSGRPGICKSMGFRISCHCSEGGSTEGGGAMVTASRTLQGTRGQNCGGFWSWFCALGRSGESRGGADPQHFFPARPGRIALSVKSAVDHQSRHFFHDQLKIEFRDAVALEIRRGIQEVDGIGHAVLYRELDGVHFVPERLIDGLRVLHNAHTEFRRQVSMVNQVLPFLRIIVNGDNVGLAKREAAHVLCEIDEFLQGHAMRGGLVVGGQQLLFVVDLID